MENNSIILALCSFFSKHEISNLGNLQLSDSERNDVQTVESLLPRVLTLCQSQLSLYTDPDSLVLKIKRENFTPTTMMSIISRLGGDDLGLEVIPDNKGSEYMPDVDIQAMSKEERFNAMKAFGFVLIESVVTSWITLTEEEKNVFGMIIECLYTKI